MKLEQLTRCVLANCGYSLVGFLFVYYTFYSKMLYFFPDCYFHDKFDGVDDSSLGD